ncbi:MAG: glycosyltransferase [Acidobacteria bacterium]|nr:glycosyltransferase [Acidobacteriota bacterium]
MKSLSVVIPSYDSGLGLGGCLEALMRQLDWSRDEIIVVDSSGSPLPDTMRRRFPRVRWEIRSHRLYPGAARNIGARIAQRDWLAFLDADIVIGEGWREVMERLSEDMIAVSGAVEPAYPRTRWGLARYWIEFGQFSIKNLPRRSWNVPSCNMIWRRSAFLETPGFPEAFRSADDLLFNFRQMKLQRRRFALFPELCVLHPADCGMEAAREHLRELGYWSGRARVEGVRPHVGSSITAVSSLYCYRCCQIWRRCLRSGGLRQLGPLLIPVARGVGWWCQGFWRGMRHWFA